MHFQDWLVLFKFQIRHKGILSGFIRSLRPHFQRRYSRSLIKKYAPSGFGLELGSGEQTIAPLARTILSDAYQTHAGASSLAKEFFPAEKIPYPDHCFDFLINEHVLEHIPNPVAALREWKRVLKPTGVLFLFLPHPMRTFDRLRATTALEHFYEDFAQQVTSEEDQHWSEWDEKVIKTGLALHYAGLSKEESLKTNSIHRHVFVPETITALLKKEGWNVLECIDRVPDRDDSFVVIVKSELSK